VKLRGSDAFKEREGQHPTSPVAWGRLASAIDRCPAPSDRTCTCPTHARFGAQRDGAWSGLAETGAEKGGRFVIS
jgi:hypothetical protein